MKKYCAIMLVFCLLFQCLPVQAMAQVVGSTLNTTLYSTASLEKRYLGTVTLSLVRAGAGIDTNTFLHDGQTPSVNMDAVQLIAWLTDFLDNDVQRAMNLSVSVQESLDMLSDSDDAAHQAAAESVEMADYHGGTLTVSQVQAEVNGYTEALETARGIIDTSASVAEDYSYSISERKEAFRRVRDAYDTIKQIRQTVVSSWQSWSAAISSATDKLDSVSDEVDSLGLSTASDGFSLRQDAYVSTVRSSLQSEMHSSLAFGLQTPGTHKEETEFTVLIVHNDEIAFLVYDGSTKNLLGSATVEIWVEEEQSDNTFKVLDNTKATQNTTDSDENRGAARFSIKNLQGENENKFYLCYQVSKAGYETYTVRHAATEGGSKLEIYLQPQTVQDTAYVSDIVFNGADALHGQASIDCNRLDKSRHWSRIYFRAPAGSGTATLKVEYTEREMGTDSNGKKVEKRNTKTFSTQYTSTGFGQEQMLDFTDQWAQLLRYKPK